MILSRSSDVNIWRNNMSKLRLIRILSRVTQDQLMVETGIDQSVISRIERDVIKPSSEQKEKLARALDASPSKLFEEA
jgi:transcriptional regulator with XRE-family HTH domain